MYYKARKSDFKPYVVFDKVAKDKQECIARQLCRGTFAKDGAFVADTPFVLKEGVLHKDDLPIKIYGVCEKKLDDAGHLVPISDEQLAAAKIAYEKEQREIAFRKIDVETQGEITKGFAFDEHRFSLSPHAQRNWQGLLLLGQSGLFEDQEISTLEGGVYWLTEAKLKRFVKSGSAVIARCLKAGREKKKLI